jgi:hypothetical protein
MNLTKMIAELKEQKQALEETMIMLERLARSQGKRRGRPPLFLSKALGQGGDGSPARKRRPFSAATRKKMAASQRKRWAAIRKKQAS